MSTDTCASVITPEPELTDDMDPYESLRSAKEPIKSKLWRCGNQSRGPNTIPSAEGDPWDTCLKPLMEEDREQCEAWKDEIQNLLIFSGLFSAVVTAFVVQTYDDLQPDPEHDIAMLLSQLVQLQSPNAINNAGSAGIPEEYWPGDSDSPSGSSIRTNICWFSSLVLSLIVVLVGTVALQWLREYQRYPSSSSPKKLFATRNLRAESFDKWYAPQIIAGLPQILQLAVVLFFLGLMDFLWQLNQIVALPVMILAGLAMAFQMITTILPTVQSFWLINKSGLPISDPPLHCPYKSPQSWAFLRLLTSRPVRLIINWVGSIIVQTLLVPMAPILWLSQMLRVDTIFWKVIDRLAVTLHLKYLGTIDNWDEFDDLWLEERQRSATQTSRASPNYFHKGTHGTDYDAARGIARILSSRVVGESTATAIYHCFQRLDPSVITDELLHLMTRGLPPWLFAHEGTRKGPYLNPPSPSMVKEENEMFFLSRLPQTIRATSQLHVFRLRQLELFVRVTAHVFVHSTWDDIYDGPQRDSMSLRPRTVIDTHPGPLFVPSLLKDVKAMKSIPHDFALDIVEQIIQILSAHLNAITAEGGELPGAIPSMSEEEPVLCGLMDVVHVASLFLAFNANPTSKGLALLADLELVLDKMTEKLSSAYRQSLKTPRLLRCAKVLASRFHFTDWAPMQRRAPLLARSFHSLVHVLALYCEGVYDHSFSYMTYAYTTQWKELCAEVLRSPANGPDLSSLGVTSQTKRNETPSSCESQNGTTRSISSSTNITAYELWKPSGIRTASTSARSTHLGDSHASLSVRYPTYPLPALMTPSLDSHGRQYLALPGTDHRFCSTRSFDNYTSSTLHNSVQSLPSTSQSRIDGARCSPSPTLNQDKTYEIV
ncbi:hypothetical protein CVT24_011190 [Panaeolus cyanescens]|uniref:DUF6535 domain-containing protein n=1 Tax=Panaeolus cyanescens TaxID=181874 RepID=A0A409VIA1_9AGAR|nr:hypothetical protein CVT24_011190 [Panaeolus cyanescens]